MAIAESRSYSCAMLTPWLPFLIILSLQNCSLLAHVFCLIIVALGYLAGALGDCSSGISGMLIFPKRSHAGSMPCILLFFPSRPVSRSGRALTRVCERDLQSVVVAEAFADWRDDSLRRKICSAFPPRARYSSFSFLRPSIPQSEGRSCQ